MSSSVDWFDCPRCGRAGSASRDQDNRTGEVSFSCKCGWNGEPVAEDEKRPAEYVKNITGFVAQTYELIGGKYVCTSQDFVSSDDVTRETDDGKPFDMDFIPEEEDYFPMDMKQPEE